MSQDAPAGGGTPGNTEPPKGFTPEQIKQLQEFISSAVGARMNKGSLKAMITEGSKEAMKAALAETLGENGLPGAIEAALDKMAGEAPPIVEPGKQTPTQHGDPAARGNGAHQQPQDDPRYMELQKQVADMQKTQKALQKQVEDEKKAAAAATEAARQNNILGNARAKLASKLDGNEMLADMLARELAVTKKWLDVDENGKHVWKVGKPNGLGETIVEALPFDEGLAAWLGSEEGKKFAPARREQVQQPAMPFFPFDPSAASFRPQGQNGQQQGAGAKITNPVLAQMASDSAQQDPAFAAGLYHAAQQSAPGTGTK